MFYPEVEMTLIELKINRMKNVLEHMGRPSLAFALCMVLGQSTAWAADDRGSTQQEEIERLKAQLTEVQRDSEQKLHDLQQKTAAQLSALQAQIDLLASDQRAAELPSSAAIETKSESAAAVQAISTPSRFVVSGDFRLRYEYNSSFGEVDSWDRGVLRGRLAGEYALDDHWSLGARLVTGDADNPRTSDVTIGDFAADLEVSLDQAYVSYQRDKLFLTGGKFAKPFRSTELVWDGDVNPAGAGGQYRLLSEEGISATASGIWFIIDDPSLLESSNMGGGQISLDWQASDVWKFSFGATYFDYDLSQLSALGSLRPRGNYISADGRSYVSDFNLFDVMGQLDYTGFGSDWPVRLIADYVKNTGARVPEDQGWGADLFVGRLDQPGHFLFRYGYSRVETDAVLGLFSNDNIILATNYEVHTLSADYRVSEHTFVGLTEYVYRWLDPTQADFIVTDDWGSRTRLNLYFQF